MIKIVPLILIFFCKLFCFCTDCQGDTPEIAKDLADYVSSLGYKQLPAASMVYEWRWELAYLGALGENDEDLAAKLRSEFMQYSVRQTLLDCARCRLLFDKDFIPSLLLHMVCCHGLYIYSLIFSISLM